MSTTYEAAPAEVKELVEKVMKKYHTELTQENVRVGVIFASNGEGAAVKHGGYPAAAKISKVSLKDRVEKDYEAELIIDLNWWKDGTRKHHEALIDHELSHLTLVPDEEEGGYKTDDLGRPCLKIIPADWNGGDGFKAVVERHGDYAVEIANLRKVEAKVSEVKSQLFPIHTPPPETTDSKVETGVAKSETSAPKTAKEVKKKAAADNPATWQETPLPSIVGKYGFTAGNVAICTQMGILTVGDLGTVVDGLISATPESGPKNWPQKQFAQKYNTTEKMATVLFDAAWECIEDLSRGKQSKKSA